MPFYLLPSGETTYIYNGTEYSGYGGPGDLVGVSGEYAPGSQFNSGAGINSSPLALTPDQRAAMVQSHVNIRGATPQAPGAQPVTNPLLTAGFGQQVLSNLPSTPTYADVGNQIQRAYAGHTSQTDLTDYQNIYKAILKQLGVG